MGLRALPSCVQILLGLLPPQPPRSQSFTLSPRLQAALESLTVTLFSSRPDHRQPGPFQLEDHRQPGPFQLEDHRQPGPFQLEAGSSSAWPFSARGRIIVSLALFSSRIIVSLALFSSRPDHRQPGPFQLEDHRQPGPFQLEDHRQPGPFQLEAGSSSAWPFSARGRIIVNLALFSSRIIVSLALFSSRPDHRQPGPFQLEAGSSSAWPFSAVTTP